MDSLKSEITEIKGILEDFNNQYNNKILEKENILNDSKVLQEKIKFNNNLILKLLCWFFIKFVIYSCLIASVMILLGLVMTVKFLFAAVAINLMAISIITVKFKKFENMIYNFLIKISPKTRKINDELLYLNNLLSKKYDEGWNLHLEIISLEETIDYWKKQLVLKERELAEQKNTCCNNLSFDVNIDKLESDIKQNGNKKIKTLERS